MSNEQEIMYVRQSEGDDWAVTSNVCIVGNYSLERFLSELQREIDTRNEKPHSRYLWKVEGKRYDLDNTLLEECDRWHLSRYEVASLPTGSKYEAVVILYYQPVVKLAIAV